MRNRTPAVRCPQTTRLATVASILLLLPASALLAAGDSILGGMSHASWTGRDGAPQGINALAQSADGYLWLGTSSGLYRFDGLRFAAYLPPPDASQFPSLDIVALAADSRNGLWIGYRLGGLSYLSAGRLTNYDQRDGLVMSFVEQILPQPEGIVWVVTGGRLMRLDGWKWRPFGSQSGLPKDGVRNVFFDHSRRMWVMAEHEIYSLTDDHFVASGEKVKAVTQFLEAPDGAIWISDGWKSVRPIGASQRPGIKIKGTARFLFGPNDSLWIAGDYFGLDVVSLNELSKPRPETSEYQPEHFDDWDGLTSKTCRALIEDREGNIWVGTEAGLDRFERLNFKPFTDVKLKSYPALAPGSNGTVWLASIGTPLIGLNRGETTSYGPKRGWGPIYRDAHDTVWQYDYWQKELVAFDGGAFTSIDLPSVLVKKVVQSITGNVAGDLFIGFEHDGIWRRRDGQWLKLDMPRANAKLPVSLLADSRGRLWAGFPDGEIEWNDHGRLQSYEVQTAAGVGSVMTLYQSGDQIWAGGTNGLSVFDGNTFRQLQAIERAALRGISGIVKSGEGDLWLNAAPGIVRLAASEVRRALADFNYRMQAEIFDFRDGVSGSPAQFRPTPTAIADSTGRLWFATSGNVVSVDPAAISRQRALPRIVIESLVSDGVRQALPTTGRVTINARNLQIDYVGISLASPQRVTYRYKLDGEDSQWQEAGVRRQAFYTSLAPGHYRFHVAAAIGDGRWTELDLPADIVVPPAFYQTTWFIVASIVALLAALWFGHDLRVQQLTQRVQDRLEQRAAERVQIARDLHDTLLQGIHGLMLRFHFVAQQIPTGVAARTMMEDALNTADKVIEEGRDRVRSLRSEASSKADLANQLAQAGNDLNWDGSVQFSVATLGSPLTLHAIVQDELYLIGREAVANAFRHARASRIDVEINSDGSALRLLCRDNGQGISPQGLKSEANGHWGYLGMQERAEKIGATLECWSAAGQGTQITVTLPGALGSKRVAGSFVARASEAIRSRWFRRRASGAARS